MKRTLLLFIACAVLLSLTACGDMHAAVPTPTVTPDATPNETEVAAATALPEGESSVLVAYFSWADNAILAEDVDAVASPSVVPPGNVQQLAGWVQEATGGDLFSIRVTEPYPSGWDECLARATRSAARTRGRSWLKTWAVWTVTTPYFWATPTGGTAYRWRC